MNVRRSIRRDLGTSPRIARLAMCSNRAVRRIFDRDVCNWISEPHSAGPWPRNLSRLSVVGSRFLQRWIASRTNDPSKLATKERRSFRDRLREHWLVVTIAGCLVLIALVCGMVYWLEVRDYESTDDALVAARRSQIHAARIAARIMDLQWLGRAKGTVRSGSDARLRAFTTAFKEAALHLSGVRPNGKMMARHPLIVPGQEDDLLVAVPLPC
jgi:hypothetical protein